MKRSENTKKNIDENINEDRPKPKPIPLNSLSLMTQIGVSIIANIAISLVIGYFLDIFFGTGPIFFLIFVFLGIGAAMVSVYHTTKKFF